METPSLTPPYIFAGEQQFVVLEFKNELPLSSGIITLTFNTNNSYYDRIPVTQIGPKAVKALFPAFKRSGNYTIIPKFDLTEQQAFPEFKIKVLSPLEALKACMMGKASTDVNYQGIVAAFMVYLIKMEESGDNKPYVNLVDDVFYTAIQRMEIPQSDLSTFLAGHYRSSNLLHFSLRHKLHWTSDWLSNPANVPASKWFASPNIRGQTPMDVAKNVGFLRHAESMEQYMETEEKDKKSMREKVKDHDAENFSADLSRKFTKVGTKLKKAWRKRSKEKESSLKPTGSSGIELAESFINQLKTTSLYSAEVSEEYTCSDSISGHIALQVGDIVHVIREESNGMCMGVVDSHNRYCKLPVRILQAISQGTDSPQSDSDDSDVYELVDQNDCANKGGFLNNKGKLETSKSQSYESGLDKIPRPLPPHPPIKTRIDSRPPAVIPKNRPDWNNTDTSVHPLASRPMVPVKKCRIQRPESDSETDEEETDEEYVDQAQAQASLQPKDHHHAIREPEQPNFPVLPRSPGPAARPLPAVPQKTLPPEKRGNDSSHRPLPAVPSPTRPNQKPLPALPPKKPQSSSLNETSGEKLPPVPQRTNKEYPLPILQSKTEGPQAVPTRIPPQIPLRHVSISESPPQAQSPTLPVKKAKTPPLVPKKPTTSQQDSPTPKKKPIPPPRVPIVPRKQTPSNNSDSDGDGYDDTLAFRKTLTPEEKSEIQSKVVSVQQMISKLNNPL